MGYQTLERELVVNGIHLIKILQNRLMAVLIRPLNSRQPEGS